MKLVFVYRNGKTFTASNVNDFQVCTEGGNVTRVMYTRHIYFDAYQETGDFKKVDKEKGILIRREGDARWKDCNDFVSIKVDKAQLSYIIVETPLCDELHVTPYDFGVTPRKQISVIPCLDYFSAENIVDVLKTIS